MTPLLMTVASRVTLLRTSQFFRKRHRNSMFQDLAGGAAGCFGGRRQGKG
jgi:hypothetical protein